MPEFDAFDSGVEPGGLLSRSDIKLLLCYLLSSMNAPLTGAMISDCLLEDGLANYFEVGQALSALVANGNIMKADRDGEIYYCVSESGRHIAKTLETSLPLIIRQKAVRCAIRLLYLEQNRRDTKVEITRQDAGYSVTCAILEGDAPLISVTLTVPDKLAAEEIKANFLEAPAECYQQLLETLTGKRKIFG